jgi:ATP-dependent DNA ligase
MPDKDYLNGLTADTLKEAIVALEAIEATSGRKAKEDIIQQNRDNPVLQEFLLKALGKDKYYVRLKEEVVSAEAFFDLLDSYKSFLAALDALHHRKVKGNDAKKRVTEFMAACHPRLRKWYMRVLDHDLRVGVSQKTVEKIFGTGFWTGAKEGEFHYHGCGLAKPYDDVYPGDKEPEFPVAVEFKLDGERSLPFLFVRGKDAPELHVYTRGKLRKTEIEGVRPLVEQFAEFSRRLCELADLPLDTDMFLDGEFLASNWNDTSSTVSKTKNFDEAAFLEDVRVILFDWATVESYMAKKFEMPWKVRKQLIMRAAGATERYEKVKQATDNIFVLGHRLVYSMEELIAFHEKALDGGFEGTMVKVLDAPHVFDRKHKYVMKLKPEDTETGEIVECCSGTGMHAAASATDKSKVKGLVDDWVANEHASGVEDDGSYFNVFFDSEEQAKEFLAKGKETVKDNVDRRLSIHVDATTVSYRYGPRLGYFVVKWNDDTIHVGGGLKYKAGQDQRMEFWLQRDELVGQKLDFKVQKDKESVAKARFNKFVGVRLREDL